MSNRRRELRHFALLILPALLLGCTADLAVIATPLSAELIDQEHLDRASREGIGRVVLLPPGGEESRGLLTPGVGQETVLLLMSDVDSAAVGYEGSGRRVRLGFSESRRRAGEASAGEESLFLDRRGAFRELGMLLAEEFSNRLEENDGAAETITVRVFLLQGSPERLAEGEALLEPLREGLPARSLVVEELSAGFAISGVRQRIAESGQDDPILLFLGSPGLELLQELTGRAVVTEALFLPPGGEPVAREGLLTSPGESAVTLIGFSPLELFRTVLDGEGGSVEATLRRYGGNDDIGG